MYTKLRILSSLKRNKMNALDIICIFVTSTFNVPPVPPPEKIPSPLLTALKQTSYFRIHFILIYFARKAIENMFNTLSSLAVASIGRK